MTNNNHEYQTGSGGEGDEWWVENTNTPKKTNMAKKNQPWSNATTMMGDSGEGDKWQVVMAQMMWVALSGPFGMFFL